MKRIPAGLLVATLVFSSPILPRLHAQESASQLEKKEFGTPAPMQGESAQQLSNQILGATPTLQDESAEQLSNQQLGADQNMQDESAQQLSDKVLGKDDNKQPDSAADLAEKDNLEKKPKVVTSGSGSVFGAGEGVDGVVYATVAQADGSIIIGGRFNNVNGQPRLNLARLKADGSLDSTFLAAPTDGVDGTVYAIALDAKGNLLVGGYFTTAQNQPLQNFVRYLASGQLDKSFAGGAYPNGTVYAVAVQPQGQIVIGGEFTQIGDAMRRNVARFKADGTLDGPVTSADATTGSVRALATLTSGGVIAGGELDVTGRTSRSLIIAP